MKRLSLLLIPIALFTLHSCHEDDRQEIYYNQTLPITMAMMDGTWRITKSIHHGEIRTADFTGFVFTFGPNGVLTAANPSITYTGAWTITNNAHNDTSPNDPIDFNIEFTFPNHFADISDDWDIQTRTANKIEMIDISSDGDTDLITFEKN